MPSSARLVPLIVASPLFLQNLDSSVMATALPSIADSLKVPPLHLNLAITAYLVSVAIFLPLSAWMADRFGAKRVFCLAIGLFSLGSALCGATDSLAAMVLWRVLQGLGGAMMIPVGRLILLRAVPPDQLVSAMVWFTMPPVLGRMAGPLFGGAIVSVASWRWIFLINIPFGLLAILMAIAFIREDTAPALPLTPFDIRGFLLLALGLGLLMGAMETAGKAMAPVWISALAAGAGTVALVAYHRRSLGRVHPVIDLGILRYPSFRVNVIGAIPLRIAIGAVPFLLPLMLQLGFGLTALQSALLTVATAIGALTTRAVMKPAIRRIGFRPLLLGATVLTCLFYLSYSLFNRHTPHAAIFATLMAGGLVSSLCMVSLGTLGFSKVPQAHLSHATALSSMVQQLSVGFGVVVGATLVTAASWWHGGDGSQLQGRDFSPAFVVVGLLTLLSLLSFRRLDPQEGAELR